MQLRSLVFPVVLAVALPLAAPGSASATPESLIPLVASSADRVRVADQVAAAKFGTTQPIDDPAREAQVLGDMAAKAPALGLDPAEVTEFFRDQIEANKIVQRGLYAYWAAHPDQAPVTRPDLGAIRVRINQINADLLDELAATRSARASFSCEVRISAGTRMVDIRRRLDPLHASALTRSLDSACTTRVNGAGW